jgi:alkylhydroperoxidase family enzyme
MWKRLTCNNDAMPQKLPADSAQSSSSRIPMVDFGTVEPQSELASLLASTMRNADGLPLNIFGLLAHHPKLLKRFNLFGGFLLNKGLVPAREREIVVLRVGWNAGAEYEFGQHTLIGTEAGLTAEEITALASPSCLDDQPWDDPDRDLIQMADELCDDNCVSEITFARLAHHWDEAQLIELVVCAGFYRLVSGFLNTMAVPLDPGVPGWPTE